MRASMKMTSFFYWIPRILSILFILFLSIFALDVFIPGKEFWYYPVALFMHLIPNFILIGILVLAWKKELVGGIVFILAGLLFTIVFRTYESIPNFLIVSFPFFVIGALFLTHRFLKKSYEKPKGS